MFTFNPLPVIDNLNSHGGFWFSLFVLGIINLLAFANAWEHEDEDNVKGFLICFAVSGLSLVLIAYNSWHTGKIITPKNERVIADFVGFIAEGEAYTERSGKQTVRRENHYLYIAYNVPGYGRVILPANKGVTYPEKAILYKN